MNTVYVFIKQRQKTGRSKGRVKARENPPPDSWFSSFCFMLRPSSSLGATHTAFIRNSHISEFGKGISLVYDFYSFISHLLKVIHTAFKPGNMIQCQEEQMKGLHQRKNQPKNIQIDSECCRM